MATTVPLVRDEVLGHIAFARSRGAARLAFLLPVTAAMCLVVPTELAAVPFQTDVRTPVWVVVALVAPSAVTVLLTRPFGPLEATGTWRPHVLRLLWSVVLLLLLALPGVLILGTTTDTWWLLLRNHVMVLGLGLLVSTLLPEACAWAVPVTLLAVCWLYGTSDRSGTAKPWALPLLDGSSTAASGVAVVLGVSGICAYALRDSRP